MTALPQQPLDCRSPQGVLVGLIDGMIAAARVIAGHLRSGFEPGDDLRGALADLATDDDVALLVSSRSCRVCGCTEDDCTQCVEKTGAPCSWVALDLCSACAPVGDSRA